MTKFSKKNHEYEVKDSNKEISDAKKFYNEIENQYLGIKSKFEQFKNCVAEEMHNRNLLIPAIKNFYKTCFVYNPNFGKKPILEEAFNLVTFNLWSDNFDQEKKYILKNSKDTDQKIEQILKLAKKDAHLQNSSINAHQDFIRFFDRGGYGKFYNRAQYNYNFDLPTFSNRVIKLVREGYHSRASTSIDPDQTLVMFRENPLLYDLSPIGRYTFLEGNQLNLEEFLKEINKINIEDTESEYKKFLNEQKDIFYQTVIIPLLKWKKSSSAKLMQELRIKKHETTKGYIYILTNKSFPDFIKIGSTMRDPRIRANELTGTGVPFPYEVKYKIATKNCEILEKKVHTILEKKRVDLEREFFKCSVDEAKKIINEVVGSS